MYLRRPDLDCAVTIDENLLDLSFRSCLLLASGPLVVANSGASSSIFHTSVTTD